jgi:hypothetical protein
MALRDGRGARHGRAPRRRALAAGLAAALFLAAGVLDTWPALRHADEDFLARPERSYGVAAAGDHLQTTYNLWLVGHQLGRGAAPWRDPYSFRPESEPRANLQGWLLGVPFWPLHALLGPVRAWNAIVLLAFVLAGGAAAAWLRALALPPGAALVGGLVLALAPYRVAQSTGHLLGLVAFLIPLSLLGLERARAASGRVRTLWLALAGAALAAIPLSGQVHLALGAIPFFVAYAAVRADARDLRIGAAAATLAAVLAALLVRETTIEGSIASGGRSLANVDSYSAELGDLFSRGVDHGIERHVFLGWATPVVAAVGLALLVRDRRRGLALVLGLGALVPVVLALGTNTPPYEPLWHALPPFRYPRVPERLLPVACLAIAALVAFAAARLHRTAALVALVLLLAVDLRTSVFRPVEAGSDLAAYAALARQPAGRLLELPVFLPEIHFGSTYEYELLRAPRERPSGYSTTAPVDANRLAKELRPLACGTWTPARERLLDDLGVRYVTLHRGLYDATVYVGRVCAPRAAAALDAHGFHRVAGDASVTLYGRARPSGGGAAG